MGKKDMNFVLYICHWRRFVMNEIYPVNIQPQIYCFVRIVLGEVIYNSLHACQILIGSVDFITLMTCRNPFL